MLQLALAVTLLWAGALSSDLRPELGVVVVNLSHAPASIYPRHPFLVRIRIFVRRDSGDRDRVDAFCVDGLLRLEIPWAGLPEGLRDAGPGDWLRPRLTQQHDPHDGEVRFEINSIAAPPTGLTVHGKPLGVGKRAVFDLSGRAAEPDDTAGIPGFNARASEVRVYSLQRSIVAKQPGSYRFPAVLVCRRLANGRRGERLTASKELTVKVLPFPEERRPPSFSGAVGQFEIHGEAEPERLAVGDPLLFALVIRGEGNLGDLIAPDLRQNSAVSRIFQVGEVETEVFEGGRRFLYSLRPISTSSTAVPSIAFSYFDVTRERYKDLRTDPIPLRVTDPSGANHVSSGAPRPPLRTSAWNRTSDLPGPTWPWYAIPASLLLGTVLLGSSMVLRRRRGPRVVASSSAAGVARGRMQIANAALRDGRVADSASLLRAAIEGLVTESAEAPSRGAGSPREVLRQLERLRLSLPLRERTRRFLESCDAIQFGRETQDAAEKLGHGSRVLEDLIGELRDFGYLSEPTQS